MAEEQIAFTYKELAEVLVRHQGIRDGVWGLYLEFGIGAANIVSAPSSGEILPAAIVPVLKIGLQRFPEMNSLSVDAAKLEDDPQKEAAVSAQPSRRKRAL